MASSIERLHAEAMRRVGSARSALARHKETIGTTVERVVTAIEATAGGGAAAALDFYLKPAGDLSALPEAVIGPVPVVAAAALALTAGSILFQKEPFSAHLAGFGNGMAGAASYAEGLRFLAAHESAAGAPAAKVTT
jgi:hypothetical protein